MFGRRDEAGFRDEEEEEESQLFCETETAETGVEEEWEDWRPPDPPPPVGVTEGDAAVVIFFLSLQSKWIGC